MGLPLFVAPVETDLPSKEAPKRDVLSPTRSAIRRSTQTETRERRNPNRRTAVRIITAPPPTISTATMRNQPPWTPRDGNRERLTAEQPFSAPVRQALREVTSRAERRRDRIEEQMSSMFGGTWHNIGPFPPRREEEGGQEGDLGWWSSDLRPRTRHARVVAPDNPRRNRSPHRLRSFYIGSRTPPYRATLDRPERPERPQSESATSNDETAQSLGFPPYRSLRRNQSRMFRALLSRHSSANNGRPPRAPPVDGLGDRDRSLSPEVWDTLLSTLTPDPQPPSAGSSFASTAASQGAGTSNAPPTAPELPDEVMDPACESGHENSDDEDTYYGYPGYRSISQAHQRLSQLVPDYNLDGPSDGPPDGPHAQRPDSSGPSRPGQSSGDVLANHYSMLLNNSWVGQLSHAGSEDERGVDRLRPNREGSAGSGPGTHTGDEEWLGMQRIVRSLAAREDIPDEWWAEAGLNRTLPQDESN